MKFSCITSLEEIKRTLEGFQKDKSPSLDGWTVEFFDLLGKDILEVVEESRGTWKVSGALIENFIAMIRMSDNTGSFKDFRPIVLCNRVYKAITKIIANRLKPMLSKFLSKEQFGFWKIDQLWMPLVL